MPLKCLALVIPEPHRAELEEITLPDPGPEDLVLRTEYTGLSVGTERWALDGYRPETSFPLVPGYLGCGVVEEVGRATTGFQVGDRLHFGCSRLPAPYCQNWMGSHVSRAIVTPRPDPAYPFLVPVPDSVDSPSAALSGLGAVSQRGTRMLTVALGDRALVTGQGLIGQMAAQHLRARGAQVLTTDTMPLRVELSARCSADRALNVAQDDLAAAAAEFAPGGFDLLVDTTGSNRVVNELWPHLRTGGQFLLQGWYPGEVSFNFHQVHGSRAALLLTSGHGREDAEPVMQMLALGRLRLQPLLTHEIPCAQAASAYLDLLEHGREEFLGVVLDWRDA